MWRWNVVILFSGNLLSQAGELLKVGLHTTDIVRGYKIGLELTLRYLDELVSFHCERFFFYFVGLDEIEKVVSSVFSKKQFGIET